MRGLLIAATLIASAVVLSACENVTIQSATERAIAVKEIAKVTIDAICERPEDDVIRVDIRKALAKLSPVDSREICTDGLDVYLTDVVNKRVRTDGDVNVTVE